MIITIKVIHCQGGNLCSLLLSKAFTFCVYPGNVKVSNVPILTQRHTQSLQPAACKVLAWPSRVIRGSDFFSRTLWHDKLASSIEDKLDCRGRNQTWLLLYTELWQHHLHGHSGDKYSPSSLYILRQSKSRGPLWTKNSSETYKLFFICQNELLWIRDIHPSVIVMHFLSLCPHSDYNSHLLLILHHWKACQCSRRALLTN